MKHTKAPWHIEEETDQLIGGDGYVLGMIYGASSSEVYQPDLDECRGNGQLIARAPLLLEENESLKAQLENEKDNVGMYRTVCDDLEAINKQLLEALESVEFVIDFERGKFTHPELIEKIKSAITNAKSKL